MEAPCSSWLCCSKLQDDVEQSALASKAMVSPEFGAAPAAAALEAAPAEAAWSVESAVFVPASARVADLSP